MIGVGFDKRLFIIFRSATPSWATKLGGEWSWWVSRVQAGPLWDDACWREERGPTCVQTASSRHQGQRHQTMLSVQVSWNKRSYVYHFISSFLFIPGMEDIGMSTTPFITKLSSSRARQQNTFDILYRLIVGSSESIRNGERTPTSRYWRRQHRLAKQSWWSWQTRRRHVSQDVRDAITPSKEGGSGADRSDFPVILKKWMILYPGIPERGRRRRRSLVPFYKDKQHNLVDHKQSWVRELLLAVQLYRKVMSSCTFQCDQRPCRAKELAIPWQQWRTKRGGHKTVLWHSQILW